MSVANMDNDGKHTPGTNSDAAERTAAPMRRPFWQRVDEHIWGAADASQPPVKVWVKRWLQILVRACAGFWNNKCFETASALTYTSILTAVPLLAILLSVLKGFEVHQAAHEAIKRLPFIQALRVQSIPQPAGDRRIRITHANPATTATQSGWTRPGVSPSPAANPGQSDETEPNEQTTPSSESAETSAPLPVMIRVGRNTTVTSATQTSSTTVLTGEQVADQIFKFVDNTDISKLGFSGLLGLLWAVMILLSRIENAMNAAWAVHRSRSLARKLSDYLNMLVIVLLMLAGLSMTVTARVADMAGYIDRTVWKGLGEFLIKAVPYLIVWPAFIFMYYYIPNTRVRLRSALISGLIAGTFFQILQAVFIRTQILVGKYNKIYGTFAVVLILLVWMYFSWCIVLWGAEVCSAHQNLRDWRRRRRKWVGTPAERETLALRMAALLASPMLGQLNARRMDAGDLADKLMLPLEPVGEMIDLFQNNGLLIQSAEDGAYIFARSPESVTVLDLLRLVRQGSLEPARGPAGVLGKAATELTPDLQARSVKDLVGLPLEDIKTLVF